MLEELLARRTTLRVHEAQSGQTPETWTLYVAPPAVHLALAKDGTFNLWHGPRVKFSRPAADPLMQYAVHAASGLVGVVLTGYGGDGADGFGWLKAAGGVVIAQEPATAQVPDMPTHAILSGNVDFVLLPQEIADKLVELVKLPQRSPR